MFLSFIRQEDKWGLDRRTIKKAFMYLVNSTELLSIVSMPNNKKEIDKKTGEITYKRFVTRFRLNLNAVALYLGKVKKETVEFAKKTSKTLDELKEMLTKSVNKKINDTVRSIKTRVSLQSVNTTVEKPTRFTERRKNSRRFRFNAFTGYVFPVALFEYVRSKIEENISQINSLHKRHIVLTSNPTAPVNVVEERVNTKTFSIEEAFEDLLNFIG
ncbi:MAG: hypothetical protein QXT97_02445 [Candidatus Diapherotrites archaeon]